MRRLGGGWIPGPYRERSGGDPGECEGRVRCEGEGCVLLLTKDSTPPDSSPHITAIAIATATALAHPCQVCCGPLSVAAALGCVPTRPSVHRTPQRAPQLLLHTGCQQFTPRRKRARTLLRNGSALARCEVFLRVRTRVSRHGLIKRLRKGETSMTCTPF